MKFKKKTKGAEINDEIAYGVCVLRRYSNGL